MLEILPFSDPVLVIEIDGKSIWDAFESALSMWPAQEGLVFLSGGFAPASQPDVHTPFVPDRLTHPL